MRLAIVVVAASLLWAETATSVVIRVNADGSGDVPTIAAAYEIAQSGDEIELGPGTYYEHDLDMKSSVDLRSESGNPADTIVDAQGLGRCLFGTGVTGAPEVRGITFQNGVHPAEGGILDAGRSGGGHNARYWDCVFRDGSAPRGGAVYTGASCGGGPSFTRCTFESNRATDGGAILADVRTCVFLADCTFRGNAASGNGGAMFADKGNAICWDVTGCTFEQNVAGASGGAIYSTGAGQFYGGRISLSYFAENSATNGGAARLNQYDSVSHSTFLRNMASSSGGALVLDGLSPDKEGTPSNERNTFAYNEAGSMGGAAYVTASPLMRWSRSTCALNRAPSGGHFYSAGTFQIRRSIFAFAQEGGAGAGPASVTSSCTDVFGNSGGDFVGPLADGASVPTNFAADPLFCDAPTADFTLHQGSPCLSAPGCLLVGAAGEGCGPVSVESDTWGSIKASYR